MNATIQAQLIERKKELLSAIRFQETLIRKSEEDGDFRDTYQQHLHEYQGMLAEVERQLADLAARN